MKNRKSGSLLLLLGIVLVSGGIAVAQNGNIDRLERRELRLDRREIRTDTRELRRDHRDIHDGTDHRLSPGKHFAKRL